MLAFTVPILKTRLRGGVAWTVLRVPASVYVLGWTPCVPVRSCHRVLARAFDPAGGSAGPSESKRRSLHPLSSTSPPSYQETGNFSSHPSQGLLSSSRSLFLSARTVSVEGSEATQAAAQALPSLGWPCHMNRLIWESLRGAGSSQPPLHSHACFICRLEAWPRWCPEAIRHSHQP